MNQLKVNMASRFVPTLFQLFTKLSEKATADAIAIPPGDEGPGRFPVVVKPETRAFLEEQAKAFGSSIGGIAGAFLDGIAMTEMNRDGPMLISAIAERFFILLRDHQLSFPAAAEVLKPVDISLNDMADMERLRAKLTSQNIQWIANHFHISYEWFVGKSEFPSDVKHHSWYKNEVGAARALLAAARDSESAELWIFCSRGFDLASDKEDGVDQEKTPHFIPVLIRKYTLPAGETYETFEIWDEGRWSYWRCRHHIKLLFHFANQIERGNAMQAIGSRVRFRLNGMYLSREDYHKLRNSSVVPASLIGARRHVDWHPSDFVERSMAQQDIQDWESISAYEDNQLTLRAFEELLKNKFDDSCAYKG
ncbi:hypothetical protein [Undibacterium sp. RuTC16W]|uniref:hypothetical protein n=1 Tax=Undibacterium sp. RuTC16W TaxID=3413048 RepID=UPI003BEF7514